VNTGETDVNFDPNSKTCRLREVHMSEPLGIYLKDHLGGAQVAVHLLEAMCNQHEEELYREFASRLLPDIQVVAKEDIRLREYDFETLLQRAEDQFQTVERERLRLAPQVFVSKIGGH
jgi:hypothetical protein